VRCDLIAEGIINAVRDVGVSVPVVVRLEGTNAAEARAKLASGALAIVAATISPTRRAARWKRPAAHRSEPCHECARQQRTAVLCQGFTGRQGTFHSEQSLAYGTRLVGGVTPGRGGEQHLGLPVFDRCAMPSRPPAHGQHDLRAGGARGGQHPRSGRSGHRTHRVHHRGRARQRHDPRQGGPDRERCAARGPNCPASSRPGSARSHHARLHPQARLCRSRVAIGTLTYEAVFQTTNNGLGQSTCVGIGGDPVRGLNFIDVIELSSATRRRRHRHGGRDRRRKTKKPRPSTSVTSSPSRLWRTSPGSPRRPASAWVTPVP